MKVTSYENSKRLYEIGFKAKQRPDCCSLGNEINFYQIKREEMLKNPEKLYAMRYYAYDLETILLALPCNIEVNNKNYELITQQKYFFFYQEEDGEKAIFNIINKDNESLADTAARLLIKLYEQNLIQFGEDNA